MGVGNRLGERMRSTTLSSLCRGQVSSTILTGIRTDSLGVRIVEYTGMEEFVFHIVYTCNGLPTFVVIISHLQT